MPLTMGIGWGFWYCKWVGMERIQTAKHELCQNPWVCLEEAPPGDSHWKVNYSNNSGNICKHQLIHCHLVVTSNSCYFTDAEKLCPITTILMSCDPVLWALLQIIAVFYLSLVHSWQGQVCQVSRTVWETHTIGVLLLLILKSPTTMTQYAFKHNAHLMFGCWEIGFYILWIFCHKIQTISRLKRFSFTHLKILVDKYATQ